MADDGTMAEDLFDIGMAFEIIKGLDGKEYPVHDGEQGIEQVPMFSFCHLMQRGQR
jgi:hypothetical protein